MRDMVRLGGLGGGVGLSPSDPKYLAQNLLSLWVNEFYRSFLAANPKKIVLLKRNLVSKKMRKKIRRSFKVRSAVIDKS